MNAKIDIKEEYKGRTITITGTQTDDENGIESDIWPKVDGIVAKEAAGHNTADLLANIKKMIDEGKI